MYTETGNQEKVSCFFVLIFGVLRKRLYKQEKKKFVLSFGKSASYPWRASEKKFSQIPAYSGLCDFVRNREKCLQITINFDFCGVVGIRGRNIAAPDPPFCGLRCLKKSTHEKKLQPWKKYNTPHRRRVIKTHLTEEEYAEFSERVTLCKMS